VSLKGAFENRVYGTFTNIPARLVVVDGLGTGQVPVLVSCAITDELCGDLTLISHEDNVSFCESIEEFVSILKLLASTTVTVVFDDPRITSNQYVVRLEI